MGSSAESGSGSSDTVQEQLHRGWVLLWGTAKEDHHSGRRFGAFTASACTVFQSYYSTAIMKNLHNTTGTREGEPVFVPTLHVLGQQLQHCHHEELAQHHRNEGRWAGLRSNTACPRTTSHSTIHVRNSERGSPRRPSQRRLYRQCMHRSSVELQLCHHEELAQHHRNEGRWAGLRSNTARPRTTSHSTIHIQRPCTVEFLRTS